MDDNSKRQLVADFFDAIGEDSSRPGLVDTPDRVIRSWKEMFRGYDPAQAPKVTAFDNGTDGIVYDQMIVDTGDFYSHCEHHIIPFFGKYWFAYIPAPDGKLLGLSKVARTVDYFSAKLQIQERLVSEIVDYLWDALTDNCPAPLGMALTIKGEHLCKTMRGAKKKGTMTTTKLVGVFNSVDTRNEFLKQIK